MNFDEAFGEFTVKKGDLLIFEKVLNEKMRVAREFP